MARARASGRTDGYRLVDWLHYILLCTPTLHTRKPRCRSCRANLVKKHILADPACELCGQPEDCDHLILRCRFAVQVYRHYSSFILLVCWLLWKSRNELVFQNITPSVGRFWLACHDEARLWSHRLKIEDRQIADAWCLLFSSM
ncbi:hypothetical protein SETIT_4G197900v2 [Setaria italica]|uniref:Uncharacterized protein n=1 Tax=Setaria italica TaxID=4555 RepID=A0A368QW15_SETIT|nr:hypothetical protein SETIT_4G197900v2 [Setaria italica]